MLPNPLQVDGIKDRGGEVHDRIGTVLVDNTPDRVDVEHVEADRRGAPRVVQLTRSCAAAGGQDLVTACDQQRHQRPSEYTGRADGRVFVLHSRGL